MKINYNNKEYDLPEFRISFDEQETTLSYMYNGDVVVYSSILKDIGKIMKITDDITPLSVNSKGNINSIKAVMKRNNISFRQSTSK